ncbi:MAG: hypothetical protein A3J65_04615 [Candidatus Buchananbacteria bacterium RIFCSPHIGHO2_02_FULL_45_11b]|uniref:Glycosyl transferase family 1 domain-containing protein n=2 Tax=Candidatus Buchananiibacteriota TaxID=1817903 RepID=A0A1G1YDI0_9BACT|nr:MAG: hypothetical protein A3J65_04615 [Candidatus Buchananbacteria bacterium RIFCSPHIGHO2_02_FULL_45_11b]OGY58058.1 MAG: hypothetical protein A3H67_01160 [Candidatus Buchananbacteria bacterium RIFCSPLOWO2_02_FULL_46_11b]
MKVLMISLDKGLLGKGQLGDVVSRHAEYGQYAKKLDIIVFSRVGFNFNQISPTVFAYPTNSANKFLYLVDAYKIGCRLFKKDNYQLVVTQAPFITGLAGWFLAKKFKAKLLVHYHGDYVKNKQWLKEKWYNFLLVYIARFISRRADGIRVMSQGIKNKLIESGIQAEKIRVISTPVSLVKCGRWDEKAAAELKSQYPGKKIILFVGRLEKEKNLPLLLRALGTVKNIYPNFILLVIGDGRLKEEWSDFAKNSGLAGWVKFIGQIEHEDLVNYYAACDFIVNSSTSESFGKIFVEAAACDKPAIATSTTGSREIIIDGQTGLLSPLGDSPALAKNILRFLNNPALAQNMGRAAKESVSKRFDGGINTREIINFWRELIS